MRLNIIAENIFFFQFLLDSKTTKEQKYYSLINTSNEQLKAIIEILYNLINNHHLELTTSLKQTIKRNNTLLTKFSSSHKVLYHKRKLIKRHYRIIYLILSQAKHIISQIIKL